MAPIVRGSRDGSSRPMIQSSIVVAFPPKGFASNETIVA